LIELEVARASTRGISSTVSGVTTSKRDVSRWRKKRKKVNRRRKKKLDERKLFFFFSVSLFRPRLKTSKKNSDAALPLRFLGDEEQQQQRCCSSPTLLEREGMLHQRQDGE